jgi:hypothetical protein
MRLRTDACPVSEARGTRRGVTSHCPRDHARLDRQQPLPLKFFAGELAGAPNCFRLLSNSPFGRLFVVPVQLHLAKNALALHLLFQDLESLLNIVVAYENLHSVFLDRAIAVTDAKALGPLAYGR